MKNMKNYLRDLLERRGIGETVKKAFLMGGFHGIIRPQFKNSLERFIKTLDRNDVKCTFPMVAEVAKRNKDVIKLILDSDHELATHGLIHIRFKSLPYDVQYAMLKKSVEILTELSGEEINGVRSPYNSYDKNTFKAIINIGLKYDSTMSNSKPIQPIIIAEDQGNKLIEFPTTLTEVHLIDSMNVSPQELARLWIKKIEQAGDRQFVVIDAHPVRMGTQTYISTLNEIIRYSRENGFRILNLREAYEMFKAGRNSIAIVLTGDIDCVSFWDYLRRIWKKA